MTATSEPGGLDSPALPALTDCQIGGGQTAVDTNSLMARFIVWLSRQDVPGHRRRRYHVHAERYLHWRMRQPDPAGRTPACYYTYLRRRGASEHELSLVQLSLALLDEHVAAVARYGPAGYPVDPFGPDLTV